MKCWHTVSGYRIIQVLGGRSNVFLLTNGERNVLIDTSTAFMRRILFNRLKRLKITSVDALILTHTHMDHAGNAHIIKEKFNPKIIVHSREALFLAEGDNLIPAGTNFLTRKMVKLLSGIVAPAMRYKPCLSDILVDNKFELNDYGFNAYILHTPGHTIGSMSVIIDGEIALVGDTMFGVFRNSVYPPFANEIKNLIASWEKLLETGCTVFIPSHGNASKRTILQKEYNRRKASLFS